MALRLPGVNEAMEETLMIVPPPRRLIIGIAAVAQVERRHDVGVDHPLLAGKLLFVKQLRRAGACVVDKHREAFDALKPLTDPVYALRR